MIVQVDADEVWDTGAIVIPAFSAEEADDGLRRLNAWFRAGPVEIRPAGPPLEETPAKGEGT